MSLTVHRAADWAGVSLGSGSDTPMSMVDIANQAGEHLINSHPWRWCSVRRAELSIRGPVTIASGESRTNSSAANADIRGRDIQGTLAELTAYEFVPGDILDVTSGTIESSSPTINLLTGEFQIVAKDGSRTVILKDSVLPLDSNGVLNEGKTADLAGTIAVNTIALPNDFRSTMPFYGTHASSDIELYGIELIGIDQLQSLRDDRLNWAGTGADHYYGAINYARAARQRNPNTSANELYTYTAPTPILEIYPDPASANKGAFKLVYRAGWTRVDDDNDDIVIPGWLEACYLQLFSHFAKGWLEADEMPMAVRIAEWSLDPITQAAKQRDGQVQMGFRQIRGGAGQRGDTHLSVNYADPIGGPY